MRIEQGALTLDPNWVSRYNPYNTTGIIIGNDQGNGLLTAVRVIGDNEIERLWQIELHTSARPVIVSEGLEIVRLCITYQAFRRVTGKRRLTWHVQISDYLWPDCG